MSHYVKEARPQQLCGMSLFSGRAEQNKRYRQTEERLPGVGQEHGPRTSMRKPLEGMELFYASTLVPVM